MTEAQIQAEFYRKAYNTYPQIRGFLFSVPNGGHRDIREAQVLKSTGTVPGIPDMLLVWPTFVAFEFKTATGIISAVQENIHRKWREAGITVHLCRSADEGLAILRSVLTNPPIAV